MPEALSENLPTVLVGGLNCSVRLYAEQIPALWQFGPVTVADHRRDDSITAIARRILAGAPPRFALAGLSMGGYVALALWARYPERVRALMLMDTRAAADTPEAARSREEMARVVETTGSTKHVVDAMIPKLFSEETRSHRPQLIPTVRAGMERNPPRAVAGALRGMAQRPDRTGLLASITVPTLVLVGAHDAITPAEDSSQPHAGARHDGRR